MASAITASTTAAVNEPRQPSVWPTRVPSGTPSAPDTATPEITTAIARPMRAGGTTEMPAAKAAAMNRPWNAPVSVRATRNRP
jgi:hypothetical protein